MGDHDPVAAGRECLGGGAGEPDHVAWGDGKARDRREVHDLDLGNRSELGDALEHLGARQGRRHLGRARPSDARDRPAEGEVADH